LAPTVRAAFPAFPRSNWPVGKNKLIINHLDKLFITNDAATIVREMEVVHPASKLVVMASEQQEKEVGDASNFVIVFAGELLQKADALLRMGLHPSDIIEGYGKASKKALELLESTPVHRFFFSFLFSKPFSLAFVAESVEDATSKAALEKALIAPIASKLYGYEALLASLVADACLGAMPKNPKNFNVDNVRVVKVLGGSISDSKVIKGMVFNREPNCTPPPQQ